MMLKTLKSLDVADNALQRLELAIVDLTMLEKLEVARTKAKNAGVDAENLGEPGEQV